MDGLPSFNYSIDDDILKAALSHGNIIEGILRINPKCYEDAYLTPPKGGQDIYIKGVYDRNTALHGDLVLVQLYDSSKWKVLHDQLEYLLAEDETLFNLVHAEEDCFESMDTFNTSCAEQPPEPSFTPAHVVEETKHAENMEPDLSVLSKNQRRRRRKMAKSQPEQQGYAKVEPEGDAFPVDEVTVISSNIEAIKLDMAGEGGCKKKPVVIVPPDMLSECSDVTDCESDPSDDLDSISEDKAFILAQKKAAQAENIVKTGPVEIIELPSDSEICNSSHAEVSGMPQNSPRGWSENVPVHVPCNNEEFTKNLPQAREDKTNFNLMVDPYNNQVTPGPNQFGPAQKMPFNNQFSNNWTAKPTIDNLPNTGPNNCVQDKPKLSQPTMHKINGGEITVKQVMRLTNWSRYVQKVGFVMSIKEHRHTRLGAGTLKMFQDKNKRFALFSPNDARIPRMKIPMQQCPRDFMKRAQEYGKRIYLARFQNGLM